MSYDPTVINTAIESLYENPDPQTLHNILKAVTEAKRQNIPINIPLSALIDGIAGENDPITVGVIGIIESIGVSLELITPLLDRYFNETSGVTVISELERLFTGIISQLSQFFNHDPDYIIRQILSSSSTSPTIWARALDFVVIVSPEIKFNLEVYQFKPQTDAISMMLAINFYEKLVNLGDLLMWPLIQPPICDVIQQMFVPRHKIDIPFVINDIINLLSALSYRFLHQWKELVHHYQILHPASINLDVDYDVRYLSNINPDTFDWQLIDYLIDYPLSSAKYFTIAENMLMSKGGVQGLSRGGFFNMRKLPGERVYRVLLTLSSTYFGVDYMIHNMGMVINEYLIGGELEMKYEVMMRLLNGGYELGVFEEGLRKSMNEREGPRVAIGI